LRIRRSQFHFVTKAEQALQGRAGAIDQRHHNLAVASFGAIFDQRMLPSQMCSSIIESPFTRSA
jgi:hypothetical protein